MHLSALKPWEELRIHFIIDGIVTVDSPRRFLMPMYEQEIGASGHQPAGQTAPATTLPDLPLGLALCVDLDGTLVKSDTLIDSMLVMARQKPLTLLNLPVWLMQGKAALKRHIAQSVTLDVEHLPYNHPL